MEATIQNLGDYGRYCVFEVEANGVKGTLWALPEWLDSAVADMLFELRRIPKIFA